MTDREWKRRCVDRILNAVKKAGRIRIRALKRATNYNRGPKLEGVMIWHEALEHLEKTRAVVCERDENGSEVLVMLPALRELGKKMSSVGDTAAF
jgi:hypothetical protein